ncbi:hypothetical protein Ocin01_19516, partial [Orchesella cincta]
MLDFHGIGNGHPTQDSQQDYTLLSFENRNGWTTFTFKRPWDTCDPRYGHCGRHNATYLGVYGALPPFPDETPSLYPGVKMRDFRMSNWKPLIQKENRNVVHHIGTFECNVPADQVPLFEEHYKSHPGGTCYTANMPPAWGKHCATFSIVWVVGSEGEMLPSHVGTPLGHEHGGATYFMVETHYENLGNEYATDSSGIRIFYTDELREYDGAVMQIAYKGHSPFL